MFVIFLSSYTRCDSRNRGHYLSRWNVLFSTLDFHFPLSAFLHDSSCDSHNKAVGQCKVCDRAVCSTRFRFMNRRASANCRYQPTCYEHAANCYTHAVSTLDDNAASLSEAAGARIHPPSPAVSLLQLLIVPAIVGMAFLHRLSDNRWERITAWVYGMGLCALFLVSTVFHIVTWKKSHMRWGGKCAGKAAVGTSHVCIMYAAYIQNAWMESRRGFPRSAEGVVFA